MSVIEEWHLIAFFCFIWSVVVPKAIISLRRRIISSWIDFLHAPESRITCYVGLLLPDACFLI